MKEAFDPPPASAAPPSETQNDDAASSRMTDNNIRTDLFAERDAISSHQQWNRMEPEEDDTDFLSHAHRTLSLLDYQQQSSECTYATDVGSHVYSKEAMSPPSEYDRQQPFFPLSSSCWENSSSMETRPGNRDTSGHARTKNSIFGPRDDYLASYPTGPHMRRSYPEAAKVDFSLLDCHSEHRYKGLDRFSAFSNCNGQSIEPRNERVDLPRGAAHCLDDETTSFSSRRWCFENGGPRGLVGYGDEIPSLSSRSCNGNGVLTRSDPWSYGAETPSLSSRQGYGDEIPSLSNHKLNGIPRSNQWHEIPSLSSRQTYGDEIPSLSSQKSNGISYSRRWQQQQYDADIPSFSPSRQGYGEEISALSSPHWRYRHRIPPSYSGQRCHDARLPSYQQGADSRGSRHPRGYQQGDSFVHGLVSSNQQGRVTTTRHIRPRVANNRHPVSNNTNNYCRSTNKKENPPRNPEDIRDQVCGPRANKLNNASAQQTRTTKKKDILSPLVRRDQFNRSDFSVQYEHAKFFMIKSYSEDDIHKGIKYNVWASTPNGNSKLDAAFHDAEALTKEKGAKCPVFLFFSVNTSGQFVGMAEMLGPVDFKKTMDFWQQNKWNGFFPVAWHIIKDIPNRLFKHITLENNDNRPVTFSRDTQEIGLPQGLEVLKIFKAYRHGTSILDDFDFYEEKENTRCARKGINADSLHEARVSYFGTDDLKSLGDLEAGMESINLHETWD